VAIRDGYPVTEGHTLVIPRRHVADWFEADPWEQAEIWRAVAEVKADLDATLHPDGYNVGFNAGEAAGQTVMHLHVHVIPRYQGDQHEPRGGVRGVIPEKQKYGDALKGVGQPPDKQDAHGGPFSDLPSFIPGQEQHLLPVLEHAIRRSDVIDILSAFVQASGVEAIEGALEDALERGARVRVLAGDYLNITHPHALSRLFTLSTRHPEFEARLYRVQGHISFHPKAYIFCQGAHGVAFVGSSNLSAMALTSGVEWNVKHSATSATDFDAIRTRFGALFRANNTERLTKRLLEEYRARTPVPPAPEPAAERPTPHPIQAEVLRQLREVRSEGARRGLVVLATGLGKTYLSAFDFLQFEGHRALFVAHREEILEQAAKSWSRVIPDRSIGLLMGDRKEPEADFLFASVQTLSRRKNLRHFTADHFDYIVIDEFHHAAAQSYRRLLGHFKPRFMLGLTATPDRMDGASLLELCEGVLVAKVGVVEGISKDLLVPFHYFGVKDELDFEPIPWRSGRFDMEKLTELSATEDRAAQALHEYRKHGDMEGRRSLIFCCSRRHADYTAQYFSRNGVVARAVHSGPTSDPRAQSLRELRDGEIEAICAVDVFNEGVDLPDINTILMLRPTESPIVFLQQLGRGLRKGIGGDKPPLTIVDFIGNHRSFMQKPQALLALTGQDGPPGHALRLLRSGQLHLPEGCSVEIETEALDMLERVAKLSKDDQLVYAYLTLKESHGRRPTAGELFASGVHFKPVKDRYPTWFDFVSHHGDLSAPEQRLLTEHRAWFQDLMKTKMSRSYKMIALMAIADLEGLWSALPVKTIAACSREILRQDPVLRRELKEHEDAGGKLDDFVRRWRTMPLGIFHDAQGFSRRWFSLESDHFVPQLDVEPADEALFAEMTAELVDFRLREFKDRYRRAENVVQFVAPIELKVSHSSGNPILRFDRSRRPDIPEGEVPVTVDGQTVTFRFVKIAINVVRGDQGGPNLLPELMRRWFGPSAGLPGTRHRAELRFMPRRGWELRPQGDTSNSGADISIGRVPFFDRLEVACGFPHEQFDEADVKSWLTVDSVNAINEREHFVVRASGDSMDGGALPISDGDLVLCSWASVSNPEEVEGKPCLLTEAGTEGSMARLKVPVRVGNEWVLRSQNPGFADQPIEPGQTLRVVGRVVEVVEERTGLVLWGFYDRDAIAGLFGHANNPSWRVGHRDVDVGDQPHTVLMVNLRKPPGTPIEHRYADRFISPTELQWESQASTGTKSIKAKRILNHHKDGRTIHLFVRYHTKTSDGTGEPYTYCGAVTYKSHESERPIKFLFDLHMPLPRELWEAWRG